MLIRSVRLRGHPGIGNLTLSLLAGDQTPYSVVVLAGANGTGKSSILDAINWAMSPEMGKHIGEVTVELQLTEAEVTSIQAMTGPFVGALHPPGVLALRYDSEITGNWAQAYTFNWTNNVGQNLATSAPIHAWQLQAVLRCFFNEASVDYSAGTPSSITGLSLDDTAQRSSRSQGIAQQISQLLIDIRNADSEDVNIWVEAHPDQPVPADVRDKRFGRFRAAFALMWPTKTFRGIRRDGGQMLVEFEEFGHTSTIDKLSTGEKQIVFRGGYLLRNRERLGNSVVLIDEPELSLHPDWQRRVVGFYREITKQADGGHPQLIIATHSPFIVHGAPGAKIIILEKDSAAGTVSESPAPSYPISLESMAVHAFSLERFVAAAAHRLLVLTEGESDAALLRTAWQKLRPNSPVPFEVRAALGAKNINITLNDSELASKIGNRAIVGLFDFDGMGFDQWKGVWKGTVATGTDATCLTRQHQNLLAWTALLPVPTGRSAIASGALASRSMMPIELLFDDQYLPPNMLGHIPVAGGAQIPHLLDNHKMAFSALAAGYLPVAFANFEPLVVALENVLAQLPP